jgi:hypothetical protein
MLSIMVDNLSCFMYNMTIMNNNSPEKTQVPQSQNPNRLSRGQRIGRRVVAPVLAAGLASGAVAYLAHDNNTPHKNKYSELHSVYDSPTSIETSTSTTPSTETPHSVTTLAKHNQNPVTTAVKRAEAAQPSGAESQAADNFSKNMMNPSPKDSFDISHKSYVVEAGARERSAPTTKENNIVASVREVTIHNPALYEADGFKWLGERQHENDQNIHPVFIPLTEGNISKIKVEDIQTGVSGNIDPNNLNVEHVTVDHISNGSVFLSNGELGFQGDAPNAHT